MPILQWHSCRRWESAILINKGKDRIFSHRTLESQLYSIGLIFLLLGGILTLLYYTVLLPHFSLPPCIWLEIFGIYCPGCGGTRAVWALFHGHFLQALWLHPLVPYGTVIFGGFMLSHTLERLRVPRIRGWRFHNWYLYAAVIILIVNVIGKNILKAYFQITL